MYHSDVDREGCMCLCRGKEYMGTLCTCTHFAMNLKLFLKIKSI